MLTDFDKAMREEGCTYYLAYGTALGAVRHKGFIPWDDDVDLYVKRKDVPSFEKAFARMDSKYILQKPFILDWPDAFYKIKLDGSYAEETSYPNSRLNHGLWLDIFVLENYPDGKVRRKLCDLFGFVAHGSDMLTRFCIGKPRRDFIQKMLIGNIKLMHRLMDFLQDNEKCEKYMQRCVDWPTVTAKPFESTVDMEMEGKGPFMMPSGWDEMLTEYFGDYMTPPPENERVSGHIVKYVPRKEESDE